MALEIFHDYAELPEYLVIIGTLNNSILLIERDLNIKTADRQMVFLSRDLERSVILERSDLQKLHTLRYYERQSIMEIRLLRIDVLHNMHPDLRFKCYCVYTDRIMQAPKWAAYVNCFDSYHECDHIEILKLPNNCCTQLMPSDEGYLSTYNTSLKHEGAWTDEDYIDGDLYILRRYRFY